MHLRRPAGQYQDQIGPDSAVLVARTVPKAFKKELRFANDASTPEESFLIDEFILPQLDPVQEM